MFNKKTMVLYCGGASSLAPNAPASPGAGGGGVAGGGGGGGPPHPETGVGVGSGRGPSLPLRAGHLWGGPQGFFPEGGRSLMGGGGGGSRAGAPLPLIGPLEGAPRAAIGCGAETPRPASLALLPERELDGCEPDSGGDDEEEEEEDEEEEEEGGSQEGGGGGGRRRGGRGSELEGKKGAAAAASSSSSSSSISSFSPLSSEGIPSPCSTLDSLPDPEPEEEEEEEEEGKEDKKKKEEAAGVASSAGAMAGEGDHLRRITLEVVGRYLLEAAGQGAKDGGGGGGSGPKFSLHGLLGRLGTNPQGEAEAEAAGATRALETLRRVGDGILEKHQLAFQGMLRKMEIKKEEDLKTMSEVATEVFRDGIINWGRIVTLISFGAFVAKHLKSINLESSINTLTEIITDVLVTDKREWLVSHNAWEGFVKFFHVEDIEGGIRSVLMTFAGVAGLGAGLAFMIR